MMKIVRKPASESRSSFESQQCQFASRPFAHRSEKDEAPVVQSRVRFSLADIDIFPRETVQPKQLQGPVEDRYEQEQDKPVPNRTGIPDRLKAGIESLSGIDMSDVRVQTNSDKPSQLNALAYTQDNQIHLGPGQERHLPHEAWHAVQQKQRRVKPTMQVKGLGINDDASLENEADMMAHEALNVVQQRKRDTFGNIRMMQHSMMEWGSQVKRGNERRAIPQEPNIGVKGLAQLMKCDAEAVAYSATGERETVNIIGESGQAPETKLKLKSYTKGFDDYLEGGSKTTSTEYEIGNEKRQINGSDPCVCAEPNAVARALDELASMHEDNSSFTLENVFVGPALMDDVDRQRFSDNRYYNGDEWIEDFAKNIARRCPTCANWIDGSADNGETSCKPVPQAKGLIINKPRLKSEKIKSKVKSANEYGGLYGHLLAEITSIVNKSQKDIESLPGWDRKRKEIGAYYKLRKDYSGEMDESQRKLMQGLLDWIKGVTAYMH